MVETRRHDGLLALCVFIIVYACNSALANFEAIGPDGCRYLDIGRNLFSGKGWVTSFNLYQFWPDKWYPAMPYIHPIYPIFAGFIFTLAGLKAVIQVNLALCALNCALIYFLVKQFHSRALGFFVALFIGFSSIFLMWAIFPLTEPLYLFLLLLTLIYYFSSKKLSFRLGLLLGLGCLVRVAAVYNLVAFAIAAVIIHGFSRQSFKGYLRVCLGLATIIGAYEVICYTTYGVFYPQYLHAAKVFEESLLYPGAHFEGSIPVLRMPALSVTFAASMQVVFRHIQKFINHFAYAKFLLIASLGYFFYSFGRKHKNPFVIVFALQGVGTIVGYSLMHWWYPDLYGDRFVLVAYVSFVCVGAVFLGRVHQYLLAYRAHFFSRAIFYLLIACVVVLQARNYLFFRGNAIQYHTSTQWVQQKQARYTLFDWIRHHTQPGALVAANFYQDTFFLDRPFVTMPIKKALTEKNLSDFLKVYRPCCIVLDISYPFVDVIVQQGFHRVDIGLPFVLFMKNQEKSAASTS